jgi:glycogen synthase
MANNILNGLQPILFPFNVNKLRHMTGFPFVFAVHWLNFAGLFSAEKIT